MRHHAAGLRRLNEREDMVEALLRDPVTAPLDERRAAIVRYAVKLTREPWAVVEEDVRALRRRGLPDRAILDVNLVCGYYAFVNRLAQGLGVELEPALRERDSDS
jgi:uncharacterized peroxidase-related enzyme